MSRWRPEFLARKNVPSRCTISQPTACNVDTRRTWHMGSLRQHFSKDIERSTDMLAAQCLSSYDSPLISPLFLHEFCSTLIFFLQRVGPLIVHQQWCTGGKKNATLFRAYVKDNQQRPLLLVFGQIRLIILPYLQTLETNRTDKQTPGRSNNLNARKIKQANHVLRSRQWRDRSGS